jgi:hypothetical protein
LAAKQPIFEGLADENMGRALMFQAKWDEGETCSRRAASFHKTAELLSHLTWAKLDKIEFLAGLRQVDKGLTLVAEALAETEEYALLRAPVLRLRADLIAQGNASTSCVDLSYRAAIEEARSKRAKYYELKATTHFARWLGSQRRTAEAQSLLADIYGWFTEGFDAPVLKEAKALLDDLIHQPAVLIKYSTPQEASIGTNALE